jgi:hypothetical protein
MLPERTDRTVTRILSSTTFVVVVALAERLVLLWLSHRWDEPGPPRFLTVGLEEGLVAASLAHGRGFSTPYPSYALTTAVLAPAYPFLWSIGIKLLHLKQFGMTVFAQAMNCVFAAATCWPIFGIGRKLFNKRVGLASAWVWAFLPWALLLPIEWTWDQSLSALVLALIVFATLEIPESASPLALSGYGLLWALGALVNPTLCVLVPFLIGWWMVKRRQPIRVTVLSAARIVAFFILALLPWTIRNYYAVDGLVFVKSNFGMEFWLGNNPAVKEIYSPELHPANNFAERVHLIFTGEPNYNREKQQLAIAYIRSHPRVFLKNTFERIEDNWSASYDSRVEPWILALHLSRPDVLFCSVFSLLSFAGLVFAMRADWKNAFPLAACLLVFPVPYYITHTSLRYRHPIDPFMAVLSVYAVACVTQRLSAKAIASDVATPPAPDEEPVPALKT